MVSMRTVARMVPRGTCAESSAKLKMSFRQPGFLVAFQFGDIEVRSAAAVEQDLKIIDKVNTEVEEGCGDGPVASTPVALYHVKAARTHEEDGGVVIELVALALRRGIGDVAAVGVVEVLLAFDDVGPGGRGGIFKVGHEDLGAGVEGVDDHLAVGRSGNLHAAVFELFRYGRHGPGRLADSLGLRQKARKNPLVEFGLTNLAPVEKVEPLGFELKIELFKKAHDRGRDDLMGKRCEASGFGTGRRKRGGHDYFLHKANCAPRSGDRIGARCKVSFRCGQG